MTTAVIRNARQSMPIQCTSTAATSTVAVIWPITRMSTSTDMYRDISASAAGSGPAPSPGVRPSSLAPALDTRSSAASALAHQPASATSASAARSSQPMGFSLRPFWRLRVPVGARPGPQQLVLEREHGRVLLRLGVVEAEQVQDAVGAQQADLGPGLVPGLLGLGGGHLRADDHVAEQAGDLGWLGRVV